MNSIARLKIVAGVAVALALAAAAGTFIEYNAAAGLTAQLAAAQADAQRSHAETDELRNKLSATQAVAQNTEARLVQEVRPDLPIKLGFRPALFGEGKVAVLQNVSNREIEVTLDVQSPATGRNYHRALVIDANRVQQIGKAEGWEFASGQQVRLNNPQYRPIVGTVGG